MAMECDMTKGSPARLLLAFSIPLFFGNLFQQLYSMVDTIVVGRFVGVEALAAVGSTSGFSFMVVGFAQGLTAGFAVIISQKFGAKDMGAMRKAYAMSIVGSLIMSVVIALLFCTLSLPLLRLIQTPENIIHDANSYIAIIYGGIGTAVFYNLFSSILRAVGDSRSPVMFLLLSSVLNIVLDLFFVIVCGMEVAGVALATAISHTISAALILRTLSVTREAYRFNLKKLYVDWKIFFEMLKIGIPAGVQSSCFAISNMIIQSSINSFGSLAMAGMTAALGVEGIVYVGSYSYHQTIISFASQNLGGKKFSRIRKSIFYCMGCSIAINLIMGFGFYWFGHTLLAIYNPNEEVIAWGLLRMKILFTTYFLCAIMDVVSGALRGLGHSIQSAVVTMMGVCVLRVLWVCFVFPLDRTMENLMLSSPVAWALTAAVNGYLLYRVCRKLFATSGRHYINLPLAESSLR